MLTVWLGETNADREKPGREGGFAGRETRGFLVKEGGGGVE